ncbi:MAG: heme ABC exporter ATP-binding protein CcmA [Firmicutes bacterium]|nr:heme ABC exporter ATP-binding protein CcmA [Bacillota bacterium]
MTRWLGGRPVLRDVSLELRAGEGLALGGANGSGKTTVWRILAGLLRPQSGCVTWEGRPLAPDDWTGLHLRIGLVGHAVMASPALSGFENLTFFARLHGVPRPRRAASEWLERVGLGGVAARPLGAYSRGQRQRWAVARAWLPAPDVLLLDEPFAGLDAGGVEMVTSLLAEHHRRGGASLVIDHDWLRACRLTRQQFVLAGGRLLPAAGGAPPAGGAGGAAVNAAAGAAGGAPGSAPRSP